MGKPRLKRIAKGHFPEDFIEDSLHRQAVRINCDDEIPVVFNDDSLRYLLELAYSLPRQGYLFISVADKFVPMMAIESLPTASADLVGELRTITQDKEDAVAKGHFDIAREIRDRQYESRALVAQMPTHEITRSEIESALLRAGVDTDDGGRADV